MSEYKEVDSGLSNMISLEGQQNPSSKYLSTNLWITRLVVITLQIYFSIHSTLYLIVHLMNLLVLSWLLNSWVEHCCSNFNIISANYWNKINAVLHMKKPLNNRCHMGAQWIIPVIGLHALYVAGLVGFTGAVRHIEFRFHELKDLWRGILVSTCSIGKVSYLYSIP